MLELGAFDALAWHSYWPSCVPFSISSSDFETGSLSVALSNTVHVQSQS